MGYTSYGTNLEIEYSIGDEDFRECTLTESEIERLIPRCNRIADMPSSFNPFSGDIGWSTSMIDIADYLDMHADEVVEAWRESEENLLIIQ